MAIVKVIEQPEQVWFETTHQGKVSVDGHVIEFRFRENNKSTDLWIWDENKGNWVETWPEDDEPAGIIYNACLEMNPEDWDKEWNTEDREDYL
jgi:hypothetical protein